MKVFNILKNLWQFAKEYSNGNLQIAKDYSDANLQTAKDYADAKTAKALIYHGCASEGITDANSLTKLGVWSGYSLTHAPQTGWVCYIIVNHDANQSYVNQIGFAVGQPAKIYQRTLNGANNWSNWSTIT